MGLAEAVDGDSRRVRCDFEGILRAMQRAHDGQKMLAAHGALLSDERLQLVVEDLRKLNRFPKSTPTALARLQRIAAVPLDITTGPLAI